MRSCCFRRAPRAGSACSTALSPWAPATSAKAALRVDDRVGWVVTLIGIPSAFLLHGYVGFIFGTVKANPWWSSPLMPVVFIFSAMVSGIAIVLLVYMAMMKIRQRAHRHALRGYGCAIPAVHLHHRLRAGNARPDPSHLRRPTNRSDRWTFCCTRACSSRRWCCRSRWER